MSKFNFGDRVILTEHADIRMIGTEWAVVKEEPNGDCRLVNKDATMIIASPESIEAYDERTAALIEEYSDKTRRRIDEAVAWFEGNTGIEIDRVSFVCRDGEKHCFLATSKK